jgi:hypothetical protein
MTEIPNPVYRVLQPVEPGEIEQPKPPDRLAAFPSFESIPVSEPCERCGCHWIVNPEAFVPEGNAECAYCRLWRGSVHRDASLSEFADSGAPATFDSNSDEPQGGPIEGLRTESIPIYDATVLEHTTEDDVGVIALLDQNGEVTDSDLTEGAS